MLQRLFSVIALLRFMGIIWVPNSGEANPANGPANNRWKYGLGASASAARGGEIKGCEILC